MSTSATKNSNKSSRRSGQAKRLNGSARWIGAIVVAILLLGGIAWLAGCGSKTGTVPPPGSDNNRAAQDPATSPTNNAPLPELTTMDVAKAVMVTVELDFGGKPPTIAEAMREIERRYQPDDGAGRTFAVLDAYGEPTPEGKLHISMHVSSEKPGGAQLVFRRTGEVLWRAKINPTSQLPGTKSLTVYVDAGGGKMWTVDGSTNPSSILTANAKELSKPIQDIWADGAEREVTFVYSACGCPVKVMVKRIGDRTVRTNDTPVIFPDDPAAVAVITRLMRW